MLLWSLCTNSQIFRIFVTIFGDSRVNSGGGEKFETDGKKNDEEK